MLKSSTTILSNNPLFQWRIFAPQALLPNVQNLSSTERCPGWDQRLALLKWMGPNGRTPTKTMVKWCKNESETNPYFFLRHLFFFSLHTLIFCWRPTCKYMYVYRICNIWLTMGNTGNNRRNLRGRKSLGGRVRLKSEIRLHNIRWCKVS